MEKTLRFDVSLGDLETALSSRELSKEELKKKGNTLLGGEKLRQELESTSEAGVEKSLHINLKPNGIYIQFDRMLIKDSVREWSFMVRDSIWGGGNISPELWLKFSRLADLYSQYDDGSPSLRLTTRQNIQFHRVSKKNLLPLVKSLIALNMPTVNGCGDNTRNPVACPHPSDIFDANSLAQKIGRYFQLPLEDHLNVFGEKYFHSGERHFKYSEYGLPRKFKIGIGGYYFDKELNKEVRCNCADVLTNDAGVIPIIEDKNVIGYQVYIGGSLGEKSGKPTFPALAGALGFFKNEDDLIKGLDAIVTIQQQVGDRKNRHWARLKNVLIAKGLEHSKYILEDILLNENIFNEVRDKGIECFRERIESMGIDIQKPFKIETGLLNRHHGWHEQYNSKWSFGIWIENGRLSDNNPQGKIKSLVDEIAGEINPIIRTTPYQDILFTNIPGSAKERFNEILVKYEYGGYSKLKANSQACVGLYTCPLAVAESESYFHPLISELEKRGYGNAAGVSIGISGCERHCPRNNRYPICFEGRGDGFYQLKLLFGRAEDEHLAQSLIKDKRKYLRLIPQNKLPDVVSVLIDNYLLNKQPDENDISLFHKRIGMEKVIKLLFENKTTSALMEKTYDPYLS
jgi:sulfite reductase (NADPH) hemoprotein beta-component